MGGIFHPKDSNGVFQVRLEGSHFGLEMDQIELKIDQKGLKKCIFASRSFYWDYQKK